MKKRCKNKLYYKQAKKWKSLIRLQVNIHTLGQGKDFPRGEIKEGECVTKYETHNLSLLQEGERRFENKGRGECGRTAAEMEMCWKADNSAN